MNFEPSARSAKFVSKVRMFMREHIFPVEKTHREEIRSAAHGGDWRSWKIPPRVEELKRKARLQGLWNLFLPDRELGGGLSVLEYAPVAEEMGRSLMAPEIFNCSAPDTGNMEVLWRYGSPEQKERWLKPLLAGDIRSVFCMTEPDVASSDATNLEATAVMDGEQVVLDGRKWWSSGVGDPRARFAIVMARTPDGTRDRKQQHSMVLVPLDAPGVSIQRMLAVLGDHDEPHGHGEVSFSNVRLPATNIIAGAGRGFEIAQGRLGPGRIHHCMRAIGAAEQALDLTITRAMQRVAFGKPLLYLGGNRERLADARIAIDQARLLTLYAAWKIDKVGVLAAMSEISAIKVAAPLMLRNVVDMAMQLHGAGGVSHDFALAGFFAQARMLRLADGPDEVHRAMIARTELARRGYH
ncbi:MAG: acyl-CoA dehydrogenase family protein [Panacagrimonas sp.]